MSYLKTNTDIIHHIGIQTPEGFEKVYRRYGKKLFGICYYQTKDEKLSQDMVQDIFHSLWKRRDNLNITVPLEHYLVRAAKLEVMAYYRTNNNRKRLLESTLTEYTEEDNSTEEQLIGDELLLNVNSLINQLPEQGKKVYKLSREKGMSNKEIAKSLKISEKGVEYHITKVLSFLRKNLELQLR